MATLTKYLFQFAKNDGDDTVRCLVQQRLTDDAGVVTTFPCTSAEASDAALTEAATALKKTAWDETDLCTALGVERMPEPPAAAEPEDA